jgi:hypothetical protein
MPDLDRIRGPLALQPCHERDHTATASRMAQPGRGCHADPLACPAHEGRREAAKAAALGTWIEPELFRDGDH